MIKSRSILFRKTIKKLSIKKLFSKKTIVLLVLFFAIFSYSNRYSHLETFAKALHKIKTKHFSPGPDKELIYSAINGILTDLDPYSQVVRGQDFQFLKTKSKGSYRGIGIKVERSNSSLVVLSILKNSPAHKQGLLPGDHLITINKQSTKKMTQIEFKKILKNNKTFTITAKRNNKLFTINIKPQRIKTQSILIEEVETGVFYLKLYQFINNTAFEIHKSLKKKDIKALLIDVRYNPGGVLEEAYKVADLFLKKGLLARYYIRHSHTEHTLNAHHSPYLGDFPIVLLLNEFSASASELLAAALQDHKRAFLIGRTSFGKGLIQETFSLNSEAFLLISVGEYKTPLGKTINAKGITPDVFIPREKDSFNLHENYKKDPEVKQALTLLGLALEKKDLLKEAISTTTE